MSSQLNTKNGLKSTLAYAISIFAVVGVGVGLTGAIVINLLSSGSTILSGILLLIIIGVALLIGPPIAGYVGIQIADRDGEAGALQSLVGTASGFLVMMLVVLIALSIGFALAAGGGAGTDAGTGGAVGGADTGDTSGGGFDFLEYLIPTLMVAIPTGLTGGTATYLHGRSSFARGTAGGDGAAAGDSPDVPIKYVGVGLLAIVVLTGGAFGVMTLMSSPADNLEASNGNAFVQDSALNGEVTITNPGDNTATAELRMRLKIDDEYKEGFENTGEITVEEGQQITDYYRLGEVDDLSQSEREQIAAGNFVIEYYINGNLKYTY